MIRHIASDLAALVVMTLFLATISVWTVVLATPSCPLVGGLQ